MSLDLDTPWVEKYRTQNFEEIVSQNIAINNLKKFVKSGDMPHMIFSGPAGTGKTSTALIIAKSMLKGDHYYRDLLELNASDTVIIGEAARPQISTLLNLSYSLSNLPIEKNGKIDKIKINNK
jgi:replication factor C small subunit